LDHLPILPCPAWPRLSGFWIHVLKLAKSRTDLITLRQEDMGTRGVRKKECWRKERGIYMLVYKWSEAWVWALKGGEVEWNDAATSTVTMILTHRYFSRNSRPHCECLLACVRVEKCFFNGYIFS
jgi:hypothetical protein